MRYVGLCMNVQKCKKPNGFQRFVISSALFEEPGFKKCNDFLWFPILSKIRNPPSRPPEKAWFGPPAQILIISVRGGGGVPPAGRQASQNL